MASKSAEAAGSDVALLRPSSFDGRTSNPALTTNDGAAVEHQSSSHLSYFHQHPHHGGLRRSSSQESSNSLGSSSHYGSSSRHQHHAAVVHAHHSHRAPPPPPPPHPHHPSSFSRHHYHGGSSHHPYYRSSAPHYHHPHHHLIHHSRPIPPPPPPPSRHYSAPPPPASHHSVENDPRYQHGPPPPGAPHQHCYGVPPPQAQPHHRHSTSSLPHHSRSIDTASHAGYSSPCGISETEVASHPVPAPPARSAARPMPLQPVIHNPNHSSPQSSETDMSKPVNVESYDPAKLEGTVMVIPPSQGEKNPASVEQNMPAPDSIVPSTTESTTIASAQKQQKIRNPLMNMKSPVTLCFERMLGAAEFLSNNPTPDMAKKQQLLAESAQASSTSTLIIKKRKEADADPLPVRNESRAKFQEAKTSSYPVEPTPKQAPKRAMVNKVTNEVVAEAPFKRPKTAVRLQNQKSTLLQEGNPFWELEQDEDLLHKVILQMALISESKDTKRTSGSVSPVIGEGFYWRDYPILEEILFDNMKNYYNMSCQNRQSRHQQEFNNRLVASIREAAIDAGLSFDPSFNDKRLRDRIRCFYKTHLQNAKKRLATLQKHPNSPIHQSHLRIYIRCVKENMSIEDSEKLEPNGGIVAPEVVLRKRAKEDVREPESEASQAAAPTCSKVEESTPNEMKPMIDVVDSNKENNGGNINNLGKQHASLNQESYSMKFVVAADTEHGSV